MSTLLRRRITVLALVCAMQATMLGRAKHQDGPDLLTRADQGDVQAQDQLAHSYLNKHDFPAAMQWFQRAADQGDAHAQYWLGDMYYRGQGVPRDYTKAAEWFRKAAEQGNGNAQATLAHMYYIGEGVPQDRAEAKRWRDKIDEKNRKPFWQSWKPLVIGFLLILTGFIAGMIVLQLGRPLSLWRRILVVPFVHLVGVALVADSLFTYGMFFLFPKCGYGFLAASCSAYGQNAHLIEKLKDFQMVNLIFRFMAIVGLGLDFLALWYLVYLFTRIRAVFRPTPARAFKASA